MNIGNPKQDVVNPLKHSPSDNSISERVRKISQCPPKQFKSYLKRLKNRFGYDNFMRVGFACFNNFEGSDIGFSAWLEWNQTDETHHDHERDIPYLHTKWQSMKNDYKGDLVDWRTMKKWADDDTPVNIYKEIFIAGGSDAIVDELNTGELNGIAIGFNESTGEFIITSAHGWNPKSERQAILHFENACFHMDHPTDKEKPPIKINPLKEWRTSIRRKSYTEIVFDPSGQETGCYNLWRGYKITKELCQKYNEKDCQCMLDHIYNIWADGDQERYDYILNWFAWKLQRPHKKMCVVICLNSGEGAGKNVVLNHMENIMGGGVYSSVSSAKSILGDFNGILEGKTLLNFDEVTYGGDHSKNNQLKALITEDFIHINKKNKEVYRIRALADFIITTNEEYFIGVTGNSRRYCPMALNNMWEGTENDVSRAYFKPIREMDSACWAKFLYNRDISDFNPRQFKKTLLFQQQVEKSFPSVIRWLYQALESGHIYSAGQSKVIHWSKLPPSNHTSDFQWEVYGNQNWTNADSSFGKLAFLKDGKRWYRITKLYEIYSQCRMGSYNKTSTEQVFKQTLCEVFGSETPTRLHNKLGMCMGIPDLDDARVKFNQWASWEYKWGGTDGAFGDDDLDDIVFTEDWGDTSEKDNELLEKNKGKIN